MENKIIKGYFNWIFLFCCSINIGYYGKCVIYIFWYCMVFLKEYVIRDVYFCVEKGKICDNFMIIILK